MTHTTSIGGPNLRRRQAAVPRWALQLEGTRRHVRRGITHLQRRVQRDLARSAAEIESDIAASEEETARRHDSLKQTDIEAFGLMKAYQQSEYEHYAGTEPPDPGRRVED